MVENCWIYCVKNFHDSEFRSQKSCDDRSVDEGL